jgi:glycine/D-amino acid oxidase-like deaminating enzyme
MTRVQQTLRSGQPLWLERSAGRRQQYAPLSGHHVTTVAIVGGGMTGALIAHAFASAGVDTTVLEAGAVGRGSTAASSALLLQEPDLELSKLMNRYGRRAGRRIWEMSRDSVHGLVMLVRRLQIRCDLEPRDAIYYATDPQSAARLRSEYELRDRFGFEATWLGPGALRRATGISGSGAIRTKGSAQFDPYRACRGVLGAAADSGAHVCERSRVQRIVTERDRVRLWTRDGSLECEQVVIATGYASRRFRPLAGRFQMYRTYVLTTEPIDARDRRELGLSNVLVWDVDRPYHYARWTPGHRLLLGGGDRLVRPGVRRRQQFRTAVAELRAWHETRLPALAAIDTEFAWEGLFAATPDSLPFIGPHLRYPRHWFALGYGGNGMTFGYLAARLLLERWQRAVSPDHALFDFGRMRRR